MNVPIPSCVGLLRLCGAVCGSRGSCRAVWRGHAPAPAHVMLHA